MKRLLIIGVVFIATFCSRNPVFNQDDLNHIPAAAQAEYKKIGLEMQEGYGTFRYFYKKLGKDNYLSVIFYKEDIEDTKVRYKASQNLTYMKLIEQVKAMNEIAPIRVVEQISR